MSLKLTTSQVAERLGVSQPTVKLWCRQGKFAQAEIEQTTRGPVWQIPETDLIGFEPPKRGRIPNKASTQPANGSNAALTAAAKVKKKGKK